MIKAFCHDLSNLLANVLPTDNLTIQVVTQVSNAVILAIACVSCRHQKHFDRFFRSVISDIDYVDNATDKTVKAYSVDL